MTDIRSVVRRAAATLNGLSPELRGQMAHRTNQGVLRGSQPEQQGEAMTQEMVECPLGRCVVCGQTGLVKKANLDRARENDEWSDAALRRLLSLALVTPDDSIDWEYVAQFPGG